MDFSVHSGNKMGLSHAGSNFPIVFEEGYWSQLRSIHQRISQNSAMRKTIDFIVSPPVRMTD